MKAWGEDSITNLEGVGKDLPQILEAFSDPPLLNEALVSVALATGHIASRPGCGVTEVTRQPRRAGAKCLQSVHCVPRTELG